jgi:glycosyl-4,4'-diaponeurosporenoate acyltransferase
MRILFLSTGETIVLDIIAWLIFHLSIGYVTSQIPIDRFDPNKKWYQTRPWEKDGQIYQKIFRVKDWKRYIPSGAALYKNAYEIRRITTFTVQNVSTWLKESCRSEFCHFAMIIPGIFFFLWNSVTGGWIMMIYAIVNNLVPIVMQRYNRPRVRKLLDSLERKSKQTEDAFQNYASGNLLSHSYE